MKILFVSSLYAPDQVGGAEKVARVLAQGAAEQGHEVVIATSRNQPRDTVEQVDGLRVHGLALRNLYWPHARAREPAALRALWHAVDRYNPLMGRKLGRVVDAERPDVVNTHNLTGLSCAAWPAAKRHGAPLVHTLHDYSLLCPRTSMFRGGRPCGTQCTACALYTAPSRRLSPQVDQVVGVSRFTLERHLASGYFRGAQAHVVHNAVPGTPAPARAAAPGGPLRLGFVGQLIPAKGIAELVRVMRAWTPAECELVVAGRGSPPWVEALRAQAPPNVRFLGFVDPAQVYGAIDVLVAPSLWEEPFNLTVLEAGLHGVPAIVSGRGGLPEIVEDGRTGLVYDPAAPDGLQAAIAAFVDDRGRVDALRPHVLARARHFQRERMVRAALAVIVAAAQARGAARAA